jgi:HlyD family secretion protein
VDSFRGKRFQAKVSQIRNAAQTVQNVVTYVVVLDVDNAELLLRPGMTANVRVVVAERKDVLLVPNAALRFKPRLERGSGESRPEGRERRREGKGEGRKSPIFVPDGERIHPVFVTPGITDGLVTEIADGLSDGQVIIVEAQKPSSGGSGSASPMGGPRPGGGGAPGGGMRRVGM